MSWPTKRDLDRMYFDVEVEGKENRRCATDVPIEHLQTIILDWPRGLLIGLIGELHARLREIGDGLDLYHVADDLPRAGPGVVRASDLAHRPDYWAPAEAYEACLAGNATNEQVGEFLYAALQVAERNGKPRELFADQLRRAAENRQVEREYSQGEVEAYMRKLRALATEAGHWAPFDAYRACIEGKATLEQGLAVRRAFDRMMARNREAFEQMSKDAPPDVTIEGETKVLDQARWDELAKDFVGKVSGWAPLEAYVACLEGTASPGQALAVHKAFFDMMARNVHPRCTAWEARWCPHHGECTCGAPRLARDDCPLHGRHSEHASYEARVAQHKACKCGLGQRNPECPVHGEGAE